MDQNSKKIFKTFAAMAAVLLIITIIYQVYLLVLLGYFNYWGQDNAGLAVALNRMVLAAHGVSLTNDPIRGPNKYCASYDDVENLINNKCKMVLSARPEIRKADHSNWFLAKSMTSIEVRDYIFDSHSRDILMAIHNRCRYMINDLDNSHHNDSGLWDTLCRGTPSDGVNIYVTDSEDNIVQKISIYW